MLILTNIILCIVPVILFSYVLNIQLTIKHIYTNGLSGIRKAYILTTILLIMLCISRLTYFILELNFETHKDGVGYGYIYYLNSMIILFISLINYFFYKGSDFKILKSRNEKNNITDLQGSE